MPSTFLTVVTDFIIKYEVRSKVKMLVSVRAITDVIILTSNFVFRIRKNNIMNVLVLVKNT